MNTKSQAAKTLSFKMSPAPHRPIAKTADYANHQMSPQIPKGSPMSQDYKEECGEV